MLLYLQDLGGAIARAHSWAFTYIDCLTITGLTLTPIISGMRALVKPRRSRGLKLDACLVLGALVPGCIPAVGLAPFIMIVVDD